MVHGIQEDEALRFRTEVKIWLVSTVAIVFIIGFIAGIVVIGGN